MYIYIYIYVCIYHILSYTEYLQERSSTVNVYTSSGIKEHKLVYEYWQLSRFEPPLEVTLYFLSTSTLAQCNLNFNILPSSVA